jgi:hypothetical protein
VAGRLRRQPFFFFFSGIFGFGGLAAAAQA